MGLSNEFFFEMLITELEQTGMGGRVGKRKDEALGGSKG